MSAEVAAGEGVVDSRSATAWLDDWVDGSVELVVSVSAAGVEVAVLRSSVHQP